jgi:hypothetical protein
MDHGSRTSTKLQPARDADFSAQIPGKLNILDTLCRAMRFEAPWGYQDEAGFHYGVRPARSEGRLSEV